MPLLWPISQSRQTLTASFRSSDYAITPSGGASSLVCNAPAGVAKGDLLLGWITCLANGSFSIAPPPGWSASTSLLQNGGNNISCQLFAKIATASEPGSYTFAFSASTNSICEVLDYKNASAISSPQTSIGATSATSFAAPSVQTAYPDEIVLAMWCNADLYGTTSLPAGVTSRVDVNNPNVYQQSACGDYFGPTVPGSTSPGSASNPNATYWVAVSTTVINGYQ